MSRHYQVSRHGSHLRRRTAPLRCRAACVALCTLGLAPARLLACFQGPGLDASSSTPTPTFQTTFHPLTRNYSHSSINTSHHVHYCTIPVTQKTNPCIVRAVDSYSYSYSFQRPPCLAQPSPRQASPEDLIDFRFYYELYGPKDIEACVGDAGPLGVCEAGPGLEEGDESLPSVSIVVVVIIDKANTSCVHRRETNAVRLQPDITDEASADTYAC